VHELTHQWLAERNPRVAATGRASHQAGYWIVEGFATFMEEGIYDAFAGKWDLFNPRSRSLDVLQAVDPRQLIPWDKYYEINQGEFAMLPPNNRMDVSLRWSLRPTIVSWRRMFYEQAGATCQFLYHGEGGKYREKLRDFICAYYGGKADLSIEAAFGMSGAELGGKTVAFARAVAAGWRPE
jgi:hypothetical protein